MTGDGVRSLRVNGDDVEVDLGGATPLAEVLRDALGLHATKLACRRGECGACTVLVGERPVMSCVTPVALVDQPVTTLEGLAEEIADVRAEFADRGAFQCGFCTPGQLVHIAALLSRSAEAVSDEDLAESIRAQLSGNICRCTGYQAITAAVCAVVRRREANEVESR